MVSSINWAVEGIEQDLGSLCGNPCSSTLVWTIKGSSLGALCITSHRYPNALCQPLVSQILPWETSFKVFVKRRVLKSSVSPLPIRSATSSQEEIRLVWENLVLTKPLSPATLQMLAERWPQQLFWNEMKLVLPGYRFQGPSFPSNPLFLKISMASPLSSCESVFLPCSSSSSQCLEAIFKYCKESLRQVKASPAPGYSQLCRCPHQ